MLRIHSERLCFFAAAAASIAFNASAVNRTGTIRPIASPFGSFGRPTFLAFFCCTTSKLLNNCGSDRFYRRWTLVGRLDLSPFYRAIESSVEEGGRPAFDPQLLISLWVYAYSQGIGSAREVARRCEYDPAFQWLTGLAEVNYHTLADFRVEKQQELDELFTQVLAALSKEGLITLEQVMQDGTKIKAQASTRSYRQEEAIREHLEKARRRVTEMGDPRNEESSPKARQAQARARREQQERLESALEELQKWQERKGGEKAKRETRVSTSDPHARVMHQPDGGLALSYNA